MTDSSLDDGAKKLLDDLARALPKIAFEEDGNGNLQYKHEGVHPFVKPILKAVGLAVWLAIFIGSNLLICLLELEIHCVDVEYIFRMGRFTRPRQYNPHLQHIGFGKK